MKKKLLIAAAVVFAVFAVPCGSNLLEVSAAASNNNSITAASELWYGVTTNGTAEKLADDLKDVANNLGMDNFKTALTDSDEVVSRYADLETQYCRKMGINRPRIEMSDDVRNSIDTWNVRGAAFAGAATASVEAATETPAIASSAYTVTSDPIFLDINIKDAAGNKIERELDVPVVITISVPHGVDGSKAVIFHFVNGNMESIKPDYNANLNILRFAVSHFSTFAIAEGNANAGTTTGSANGSTTNGNTTNGSTANGSTTVEAEGPSISAFESYRENLCREIADAKDGTTFTITRDKNINALPNDIMKALYMKKTVALKLEYTFEGKDYTVTIPAGKAENNDIQWYGPLYLQMRYGK